MTIEFDIFGAWMPTLPSSVMVVARVAQRRWLTAHEVGARDDRCSCFNGFQQMRWIENSSSAVLPTRSFTN